jgi:hypothetical protein
MGLLEDALQAIKQYKSKDAAQPTQPGLPPGTQLMQMPDGSVRIVPVAIPMQPQGMLAPQQQQLDPRIIEMLSRQQQASYGTRG